MRQRLSLLAACAVLIGLTGCGGDKLSGSSGTASGSSSPSASASSGGAAAGGSVVIGSAGFTEINLMAEMYAALLKKAGYSTQIKVVQNREVYEPALEKGQIDVVPDYLATMAEFVNRKKNGANAKTIATNDATATATALKRIATPLSLTVLTPAKAVDQNAFVVTKTYASKNSLTTLTDLGASGKKVVLAATEECPTRPFCQPGLEKTYKIKVSKVEPLGFGTVQVKQAVKSGKAQLGLAGTTDGTLEDFGLVALKDDKGLQLADNLVPIVGRKYAKDTKLASALDTLASTLTTDDLAAMNKKVDAERQKAADVAAAYLKSKGLA